MDGAHGKLPPISFNCNCSAWIQLTGQEMTVQ